MKILFTTISLLFVMLATAQTKVYNDPAAKQREVSGSFNKISVGSGVYLYLTQGDENAIAVSVSDEKYESGFKTEIVDGTLKIYYDNGSKVWKNDNNRKLKAYVSYKTINALDCSSGSSTTLTNPLKTSSLALSFTSGCVFTGQVDATDATAEVNSGAMVNVSGKLESLTLDANSGGNFKGNDLTTNVCTATVSSGAAIGIRVEKQLTASANSGGQIRYTGPANLIRGKVNSGGEVKHDS